MNAIKNAFYKSKLASMFFSIMSKPLLITLIIIALMLLSNSDLQAGDGSGMAGSGSGMN